MRGGDAPPRLDEGEERAPQLGPRGGVDRGSRGQGANDAGAGLDLRGQPSGQAGQPQAHTGQGHQPGRAHRRVPAARAAAQDQALRIKGAHPGQPGAHLRGEGEVQVEVMAVQDEEGRRVARA